ncbi:MAG: RNA polymerase sigma factor, partial [Planctomycetota bacterium]
MNDGPNLDACETLAQHQAIVWRIVRSFCSRNVDQDDLFQEICVSIWAAREKFPSDVKPTTYVYRIALNRAISWRRKRIKDRTRLSEYRRHEQQTGAHADAGREASMERSDDVRQLYRAIAELKPPDRCVILLVLDGLDYSEMSDILGISPAAVRKRVSRSKKRLMAMQEIRD